VVLALVVLVVRVTVRTIQVNFKDMGQQVKVLMVVLDKAVFLLLAVAVVAQVLTAVMEVEVVVVLEELVYLHL
jgi:hypothetical protein